MNALIIITAAAVLAAAVFLVWNVSSQLQNLAERIGRLDEVTRDVQRVGQSITGLEQILASPKLRGSLGEWTLESLLYEVLPHSHVLRQHRLHARAVVVDVAVRTADDRLIAIDSKFPLESFRRVLQAEAAGADTRRAVVEFQRAVRDRIDEISSKYISPEDGTLDFALMYVPSESIYYEIAVRDRGNDLLDYAREQRVVVCSPNTCYAYLQAIMMGVKGIQIAESAREIQETLEHLRQDFVEARGRFDRASDQLRFAAQNVDAARQSLRDLEMRLERATAGQPAARVLEEE
jgi:DNA recombination protein RmuC